MSPLLVLVVAFVAGSIPFSNLAARITRGVDLRTVRTGTVSGTSLFRVSGFPALVVGKVFRETGLGGYVAEVLLTPVLAVLEGPAAALAGITIAVPMLVKRVAGNGRPTRTGPRTYLIRLLYDREPA